MLKLVGIIGTRARAQARQGQGRPDPDNACGQGALHGMA